MLKLGPSHLYKIGRPCRACGGRLRYKLSRNCVPCARQATKDWQAERRDARAAQRLLLAGAELYQRRVENRNRSRAYP